MSLLTRRRADDQRVRTIRVISYAHVHCRAWHYRVGVIEADLKPIGGSLNLSASAVDRVESMPLGDTATRTGEAAAVAVSVRLPPRRPGCVGDTVARGCHTVTDPLRDRPATVALILTVSLLCHRCNGIST